MKLDDAQIERYSRQIILRELGGVGQAKLLAGRVAVAGGGFAAASCLSYLAGAGVGSLRVLSDEASGALRGAPFAAPAQRSPDASIDPGAARSSDSLDAYDAVVLAGSAAQVGLPRGRPRLGAVRIEVALERQSIALLLIPSSAPGCLACAAAVVAAASDDQGGESLARPSAAVAPSAAALGEAGAMAALAVCRWLAEIGSDEGARALALAPGGEVWVESAVARLPACPRGCRA